MSQPLTEFNSGTLIRAQFSLSSFLSPLSGKVFWRCTTSHRLFDEQTNQIFSLNGVSAFCGPLRSITPNRTVCCNRRQEQSLSVWLQVIKTSSWFRLSGVAGILFVCWGVKVSMICIDRLQSSCPDCESGLWRPKVRIQTAVDRLTTWKIANAPLGTGAVLYSSLWTVFIRINLIELTPQWKRPPILDRTFEFTSGCSLEFV